LSTDPLTKDYPWYTPYQFAGNTPIQAIDLDGLEEWKVNWSPKLIYGPYKDLSQAEATIWDMPNRPILTNVSYVTTAEKITQTGYANHADMTPIMSVRAATSTGQVVEMVMMRAGLDKDSDGSARKKFQSKSHRSTLSSLPNLDASVFAYTTLPRVLRDHDELDRLAEVCNKQPSELYDQSKPDYNVNMGAFGVVVGTATNGSEVAVINRVSDDSGKHGGESALYVVWQFGDGSFENPLPNSSFPRKGQFEHWFFPDTVAPTTQAELMNSPDGLRLMQILYMSRKAIDAAKNNQTPMDNCTVTDKCD
jgi:hypothetical protein